MFGIYLFVALATQLVTSAGNITFDYNDAQFVTQLPAIHGIKTGSPVTIKGELAGLVDAIEKIGDKENNDRFKVSFSVGAKYKNTVQAGALAFVTSPVVPEGAKISSALDLIPVQGKNSVKSPSNNVPGFSSYKEFWNSHDIKL
ncbi:MAG: MCE family protein [Deltaproteobacteria bacterium]|nr:MCE family protein [Deltaproteobacteria bacterium]